MKKFTKTGILTLALIFSMAFVNAQNTLQPAADIATDITPVYLPANPSPLPSPVKDFSDGLLYDNGPIVTHPGGGPAGSDYSLLENPPLTAWGFGVQVASGNRLADDFEVTGSTMTVDSIVLFFYQTNSTTTSTITAVNLQIWDGEPGTAGALVIWGNTTTNVMIDTYWSHCYRGSDLINTTRPVMRTVCGTTGLSLEPGTYWVDWQADGTLTSGPWGPPITILGQFATGNAIQYTTTGGAWAPIMSGTTYAQGLPFEIWGPAAAAPVITVYPDEFEVALVIDQTQTEIMKIFNTGDADLDFTIDIVFTGMTGWLSADPLTGTVEPGDSADVEIEFNSTGLPNDVYTATINVNSNDPVTPQVQIAAALSVITGIPKNPAMSLTVSPNPARNFITIQAAGDISGVSLITQTGQILKAMKTNSRVLRMDVSTVPGGVYILSAETASGKILKKIVIY